MCVRKNIGLLAHALAVLLWQLVMFSCRSFYTVMTKDFDPPAMIEAMAIEPFLLLS